MTNLDLRIEARKNLDQRLRYWYARKTFNFLSRSKFYLWSRLWKRKSNCRNSDFATIFPDHLNGQQLFKLNRTNLNMLARGFHYFGCKDSRKDKRRLSAGKRLWIRKKFLFVFLPRVYVKRHETNDFFRILKFTPILCQHNTMYFFHITSLVWFQMVSKIDLLLVNFSSNHYVQWHLQVTRIIIFFHDNILWLLNFLTLKNIPNHSSDIR